MLEPSITAVLRTRYTIRWFFIVFGALFVATALLAFWIGVGGAQNSLGSLAFAFLTQLSSTFATIMAIYAVWVLVTPPELRNSVVVPIRPKEISEFLSQIREDFSYYIFLGRSGNSFRSQVLPMIDRVARERREIKFVRVVVPDPQYGDNARSYGAMIRGLSEKATDDTLSIAVISMAIDLAGRAYDNTDLRIEMGLCPTLPVLRMDLSDRGGVLTRDAKVLPAIYCGPGGYLEMFRAMAESEYRQSRKVAWHLKTDPRTLRTATEINAAFEGLPPATDDMVPAILKSLQAPKSRYER